MRYTVRMNSRWLAVAVLCASGALFPAQAQIQLAGLFTDHMVLQRNARVQLWGSAAPGELIRVRPSWYEQDAAATADSEGRFVVALTTPEASGPHTIKIQGRGKGAASAPIVLSDVMVGEVWLASGQSNMEMGVGYQRPGYSGVLNWEQELADADRPRIRFFNVENQISPAELDEVRGAWVVADPKSVNDFSATGWFFAKRLEHELDVPVGVVAADWGGTPAQAWTSARALRGFPRFEADLAACAALKGDSDERERERAQALERYERELLAVDPLSAAKAQSPRFDDRAWTSAEQPGVWSGDLAGFDGVLWMRRTLEIPAAWAGMQLELSLGTIDDEDTTWWEGVQVGATQTWDTARRYRIAPELVRAGSVQIAVRVIDTGGEGGMRGAPTILYVGRPDTREKLSLAGSWRIARGAEQARLPRYPARYEPGPGTASVLFNGMIAPLQRNTFAGAIWYQGESNVGYADEYTRLFPALIQDWREHFGRELPFYYVQIAPHLYRGDSGNTALLRESQRAALALPRTGMVVTLDVGDPRDIHPKNKQAVGRRLASFALRDVYGRADEVCEAPAVHSARAEAGGVKLEFQGSESLEACGESAFEIAGEDGVFVPATQAVSGRSVRLSGALSGPPTQVRYAWSAAPTASLRGASSQLPVAPFSLKLP